MFILYLNRIDFNLKVREFLSIKKLILERRFIEAVITVGGIGTIEIDSKTKTEQYNPHICKKNMEEEVLFDPKILLDLIKVKMPYGRYKGQPIYRLPEAYLVWFKQKGFPPGKIGILMATMYEIQLNGLEYLLEKLSKD